MNDQSDEILMGQVAEGNLDLLKVLFDRHHLHLFNFLYKMSGDRMLSEDLTQEVFYKLIKYRSTYNNGKFVSWMFTIARNCLKSHFTRNKVVHSDVEEMQFKIVANDNEQVEDYSHLHHALGQLETSDREILVLHRFQNMGYEELAEVYNSSAGAIKTKACRALKKLKKIYLENL
ncbi:RNA polymerase sigma factor [Croceivirga thetidis]|uniref:RNA polymerase sigma factor n=1 Tax=Croceivirga thetidis TaxID=2721623 RepID=A0ABX1GM02_9FLAO|nr:RNA polymerase sigma factor [Croceivirga thetidis]NKI30913.1 RNA polymerase sigma factor [Croceivirga thetidis]